MSAAKITYTKLFSILRSLGFREERPVEPGGHLPRVFVHEATDTVLLFRDGGRETISSADQLSTEVHLQAKRITDEPLETLAGISALGK